MIPTLAEASAVLESQPFSRHLGARLTIFEPGRATIEIDIADHHRQQMGLVHGGVLAFAVDNALTFAAGTVLGTGLLTSGLSIDYLRGARNGTLKATAEAVHHNGRHAVCTVVVEQITPDGSTRLCAIGRGTALVTDTTEREQGQAAKM